MIILAILVVGLAAGWVAQLALGERGRPCAEALVAGLVGSFVRDAASSRRATRRSC